MADLVRADLIRAVLEKVGVASSGQPISAEDSAFVSGRIPGILERLGRHKIVSVDPDSIPPEYLEDLKVVVAYHVAGEFGGAISMAERDDAEASLRFMARRVRPRRLKVDGALTSSGFRTR